MSRLDDPALVALNPGKPLPHMNISVTYRSDSSGSTYILTDYFTKVDQEQWQRYIVNLADPAEQNRQGKCGPPPKLAGQPQGPRDDVCWVFFRIPFRTPDDSLGHPLLRRARALRITWPV